MSGSCPERGCRALRRSSKRRFCGRSPEWGRRIHRGPSRPISRVLYPPQADGDHLSSPPNTLGESVGSPPEAGRCCHRGPAANPGTDRAPIVPLFGLAPGGVWPSLRHRRRPDALTVRFHPYLDRSRRYVSVPLSVSRNGSPASRGYCGSLGVTQHHARRSPDFPPRQQVGAAVTQPTWLSKRTLAHGCRGVKLAEAGPAAGVSAGAFRCGGRLHGGREKDPKGDRVRG